jgi:hypothetical protein
MLPRLTGLPSARRLERTALHSGPGAADQPGRKCATEFTPRGIIELLQRFDFGGDNLALAAGARGDVLRKKLKRVKPPLLFRAGCRKQVGGMAAVVRIRTVAKDERGNRKLPAQ